MSSFFEFLGLFRGHGSIGWDHWYGTTKEDDEKRFEELWPKAQFPNLKRGPDGKAMLIDENYFADGKPKPSEKK